MKFALNIRSKSYIERYNNNNDVNDLQFLRACTSFFFAYIGTHIRRQAQSRLCNIALIPLNCMTL